LGAERRSLGIACVEVIEASAATSSARWRGGVPSRAERRHQEASCTAVPPSSANSCRRSTSRCTRRSGIGCQVKRQSNSRPPGGSQRHGWDRVEDELVMRRPGGEANAARAGRAGVGGRAGSEGLQHSGVATPVERPLFQSSAIALERRARCSWRRSSRFSSRRAWLPLRNADTACTRTVSDRSCWFTRLRRRSSSFEDPRRVG
jgi:hypothetical protein